MSYQCPTCQKVLKTKKSLNRHIKTQHPEQPGPGSETKEKPAVKALEVLAIKKPPEHKEKTETKEPETSGYHCVGCGGQLSKGQNPCPTCGAELDWSQV